MTKWILFILLLLGIDQGTKIWVSSTMSQGDTIPVIRDFFHITYTRNTGVLFGGLQGTAAQYYWVFLIFAVIAVGVFGYMFVKSDFKDKRTFVYRFALSLLIAGTLGNAIDRLLQIDHAVIDFIDFNGIWAYIFNFADVFLNVGIFFFFIDIFFLEKKRVENNG
jgi:signal peptidase II